MCAWTFIETTKNLSKHTLCFGRFITRHLLTLQKKIQVNAAVAAAKEAFPDWSSRSPEQRAQVLNKLADLIEANLDEFAQAESRDQGLCVSGCVFVLSVVNT